MNMQTDFTERTYGDLRRAYDFFNAELFQGRLPRVLITLRNAGPRSRGYFASERFTDRTGDVAADEIALNAQHFHHRTTRETISTLVHEMAHVWQFHFGTPSPRGYHNAEWADFMDSIGLIASNTGAPGGKRTGTQMTHYIEEGGAFDLAYARLVADGFDDLLGDAWTELADGKVTARAAAKKAVAAVKRASKTKFTCPCCNQNAWGAPTIKLVCGTCDEAMEAA